MKKFESPEITVVSFAAEDIITASGTDGLNMGDWVGDTNVASP